MGKRSSWQVGDMGDKDDWIDGFSVSCLPDSYMVQDNPPGDLREPGNPFKGDRIVVNLLGLEGYDCKCPLGIYRAQVRDDCS